jgi:hypothetical protein
VPRREVSPEPQLGTAAALALPLLAVIEASRGLQHGVHVGPPRAVAHPAWWDGSHEVCIGAAHQHLEV